MKNEISGVDIEGKLIAHNRLLKLLISHIVMSQENSQKLLDEIRNEVQVHDSEEDPGVEPSIAYAIENAAAFELGGLLESCEADIK